MEFFKRLFKNPYVNSIILVVTLIGIPVGVTSWFYERQLENTKSKYEADIAALKLDHRKNLDECEKEIKSLKLESLILSQPKREDVNGDYIKDKPLEETIVPEDTNKVICEIINPQPQKEITWDKEDLIIEGRSINTNSVWILVQPFGEENIACSLIRINVDDNGLWKGKIHLPALNNQEERYNIYVFQGNVYNDNYFQKIQKKIIDSQLSFELPDGKPESCAFLEVTRTKTI